MRLDVNESITYKGHLIEVVQDEHPLHPREDFDNLTEFHYMGIGHYVLGDRKHAHNSRKCMEDMLAEARKQGDMIFQLFAYIHGGIVLSLESFMGKLPQGHAEFDSGQCGFVIVRKKEMLDNFGGKKWTKKLKERAYEIALNDVDIFNKYMRGEVYGYEIDDEDSGYGYYSTEDAVAEAKSIIDYNIKRARIEHNAQLKKWIKDRVPLQYRTSCLV